MATIYFDCGCIYQQGFPGRLLSECAKHVKERLGYLEQFNVQIESIAAARGFVSSEAMIANAISRMQKLGLN